MKLCRFFSVFFIIFLFQQQLFAWDLVRFFLPTKHDAGKLTPVFANSDIRYLPALKQKSLFASIEDMSICRKDEVRKYIYHYLTINRKYTIRAIRRSRLYLDDIYEIFRDTGGIPEDLALLPLLESGFYPFAVSRSSAVGLWQLMRGTSRYLGLKINRIIDERRNIEKSTRVAIRHLKNMYKIFGSWELALAAYNGGGKYVKLSMRETGATSLWELINSGVLAKQTHEYVPRFAALLVIYKNQELFGIKDEIKEIKKTETMRFVLKKAVPIYWVARLSGTTVKKIKQLNPELKGKITPPFYRKYAINLPVRSVKRLAKRVSLLYKHRIRTIRRYRVKQGDTLLGIARRYRASYRAIIRYNNIKRPGLIHPGRVLLIPYH